MTITVAKTTGTSSGNRIGALVDDRLGEYGCDRGRDDAPGCHPAQEAPVVLGHARTDRRQPHRERAGDEHQDGDQKQSLRQHVHQRVWIDHCAKNDEECAKNQVADILAECCQLVVWHSFLVGEHQPQHRGGHESGFGCDQVGGRECDDGRGEHDRVDQMVGHQVSVESDQSDHRDNESGSGARAEGDADLENCVAWHGIR